MSNNLTFSTDRRPTLFLNSMHFLTSMEDFPALPDGFDNPEVSHFLRKWRIEEIKLGPDLSNPSVALFNLERLSSSAPSTIMTSSFLSSTTWWSRPSSRDNTTWWLLPSLPSLVISCSATSFFYSTLAMIPSKSTSLVVVEHVHEEGGLDCCQKSVVFFKWRIRILLLNLFALGVYSFSVIQSSMKPMKTKHSLF